MGANYVVCFQSLFVMSDSSISIEQLNLGFNQPEDRLLLKVGMSDESEIQLWITRRICKELWHLLQNSHAQIIGNLKAPIQPKLKSVKDMKLAAPTLAKPETPKDKYIADFKYEAELQKSLEVMDFSADYTPDRTALLDAPGLVVECQLTESDSHITRLAFKAQSGETVNMGLTLELVVAMTNMMQLATREAGWDLVMLQNNVAKRLQPTAQVIH
jgi:hypothetical protein